MSNTIVKTSYSPNVHWIMWKLKENPLSGFKTCYPDGADFVFQYSETVGVNHQTALDALLADHDDNFLINDTTPKGKDLLIEDILEDQYKHQNFNSVDFSRHLKPPNALNKEITKREDGAPDKAEYFRTDGVTPELAAEIQFYYIYVNDNQVRRSEHLRYKKKDNSWTDEVVIKDKKYDLTKENDFNLMVEERQNGRKAIISTIKSNLLATLTVANPTLTRPEVIALGKDFFNEYKNDIDNFIELAEPDFKDGVFAIDLNTTDHDWLSTEIATGYNLQDYIVDKLDYTTVTNHPEA